MFTFTHGGHSQIAKTKLHPSAAADLADTVPSPSLQRCGLLVAAAAVLGGVCRVLRRVSHRQDCLRRALNGCRTSVQFTPRHIPQPMQRLPPLRQLLHRSFFSFAVKSLKRLHTLARFKRITPGLTPFLEHIGDVGVGAHPNIDATDDSVVGRTSKLDTCCVQASDAQTYSQMRIIVFKVSSRCP